MTTRMTRASMRMRILCGCVLALVCLVSQGAEIASGVSKNNLVVGEPFTFQIKISGDKEPSNITIPVTKDISIQSRGTSRTMGGSTIIINGQTIQRGQTAIVQGYQCIPRRAGTLTLPRFKVDVDGESLGTEPVTLSVREPPTYQDFSLAIRLSKPVAYVGEPISLDMVFYHAAEFRNASLTLQPDLSESTFHVYELGEQDTPPEMVNGRQFETTTIRNVLIPKRAGRFPLSRSTMLFEGANGYQNVRNIFTMRVERQPNYQPMLVGSQELQLEVRDLPSEGQPANFSGLVGNYTLTTTAAPTEVNVGDPITLTVTMSGPPYLEHVDLPPLAKQPEMSSRFKIPEEMEAGKVEGNTKRFTQTIRALSASVKEVPPIELPYFDTTAGEYRVARSRPIPIKVNATRVVTASDAEGVAPVSRQTSEIEALAGGIAHNYDDLEILRDQRAGPTQWMRSPFWLAMLGGPPLAYIGLLVFVIGLRKRLADPQAVLARRAFGELTSRMNASGSEGSTAVLEALREYLGAKLRTPAGALTFNDVKTRLKGKGADEALILQVGRIFEQCEASRYSGGAGSDAARLSGETLEVCGKLEKVLK